MTVDKDIETFFETVDLDWRNFSFEELVNNYCLILSLFADEDKVEFYLNINKLIPFVKIFSKILNRFFKFKIDGKIDVTSFCVEGIKSLGEKSEEEYDIHDIVLGFSLNIFQSFIDNKVEDYMIYKDSVFNILFINCCHIKRFSQSIDEEFEASKKWIGVMTS